MTTDEAIETLHHRHPELRIDWAGGVCPHQAEGSLYGVPFYFRFRHIWMDDADRARAGR